MALIKDVQTEVIERDELIHCIALALLTQKNLFILGDTGQAKSYAVNEFRKRITGANQFEKLMSKQADEEQLFGRLDLASIIPGNISKEILIRDDGYKDILAKVSMYSSEYSTDFDNTVHRDLMVEATNKLADYRKALAETQGGKPLMVTTGKIPDSEIVFLDEIFKANEGILNSLLTALNEHKWTNEGTVMDLPVISFFSASNEIPNFGNPEEKILKPLYDRFELKVLTRYVEDRDNRLKMLEQKKSTKSKKIPISITLDELKQMQKEVMSINIPLAIDKVVDKILCELRKSKIHVSDRKFFNYHPIVQAEAYLDGADTVQRHHLLALTNYFWNTPEEIAVVKSVLERNCINPAVEEAAEMYGNALESHKQFTESTDKVKALVKLRNEFIRIYDGLCKLKTNANQEELAQIAEIEAEIEGLSKNAHSDAGMTYVELGEIKRLNT